MKQGEILKCLLEYKKMDVATLSRITNISNSTLYSIIRRNNNNTRKEILAKISKALSVPISIWNEENEMSLELLEIYGLKPETDVIDREMVKVGLEQKKQPFEFIKYALDCIGYNNKYSVEELKNIIEKEIPVSPKLKSDIYRILFESSLLTDSEMDFLEEFRMLSNESKNIIEALIIKLKQSDKYEKERERKLYHEMYLEKKEGE